MPEYTVSTKLQAKVDQYVTGMKKAGAVTKSMQDATAKARKEQEHLDKIARVVGATVAVAFAGKIIKAASDLNETISKTGVVFGKNATQVQAWAKTSAKSFGMSENAAAGAAATYGNLFVSMGLTQDKAADMSTALVELAGDLASFNNVDPAEALAALQSGLVGETEPLRKFGVNLNDATLRQQALKMGLISTTKDALDPATKAQAAYALILEQTKTAQGDFARTSDGLANRMRILNAEWENAQAGLGQALLDPATDAVGVLNDLLGVFNALPAPIKTTTLVVGLMGAAFLLLAPRIAATKVALKELNVGALATRGNLTKLGKAAGALAAFTVATQVIQDMNDATINAGKGTNELKSALLQLARGNAQLEDLGLGYKSAAGNAATLNEALANVADNHWWDQIGTNVAGMVGVDTTFKMAGDSIADVDRTLADMVNGGSVDEARAAFAQLRESFVASGGSAEDFDRQFTGYRDALAGYKTDVSNASDATSDLGRATAAAGAAAEDAAARIDELNDALALLRGEAQSVDDANADLEASFDDARDAAKGLKDAVNKTRTALNLSTPDGRKAKDALDGITDALFQAIPAYAEAGKSVEYVQGKTEKARVEFIKTATQAGLNKTAAEKLANAYGLIPAKVATRYTASGVDAAKAKVDDLKTALDRLPKVTNVRVQVTQNGSIKGTGGGQTITDASGGYVAGPGSSTSDSIPARLSNGEYVVKASAVRKYGPGMLDNINRGTYASGGMVGSRAIPASTGGTKVIVSPAAGTGGINVEQLLVQTQPGESATESVPRGLRRAAFELGMGA